MEKKSWSPKRLFQELGSDTLHGVLTKQRLEDKAKDLMRLHCGRTLGLEVEEPFEILDLNGDGVVEDIFLHREIRRNPYIFLFHRRYDVIYGLFICVFVKQIDKHVI